MVADKAEKGMVEMSKVYDAMERELYMRVKDRGPN